MPPQVATWLQQQPRPYREDIWIIVGRELHKFTVAWDADSAEEAIDQVLAWMMSDEVPLSYDAGCWLIERIGVPKRRERRVGFWARIGQWLRDRRIVEDAPDGE